MSDSLWPHESQHARPPCPSPTPRVHSNSCPSSRWCHPAISSSVVPFSSCPQSLPASKSFPMSQLFAWGGQSTGVSALTSFLPKKSQGWSQYSLYCSTITRIQIGSEVGFCRWKFCSSVDETHKCSFKNVSKTGKKCCSSWPKQPSLFEQLHFSH